VTVKTDFFRYFFKNRKEQRDFLRQLSGGERREFTKLVLDWIEVCHKEPESDKAKNMCEVISAWIFGHSSNNQAISAVELQRIATRVEYRKLKAATKAELKPIAISNDLPIGAGNA